MCSLDKPEIITGTSGKFKKVQLTTGREGDGGIFARSWAKFNPPILPTRWKPLPLQGTVKI